MISSNRLLQIVSFQVIKFNIESYSSEKNNSCSLEMITVSEFIEKAKKRIELSKYKIKDFELDQRNEFEEAIVIKRVPGSQKLNLKKEDPLENAVARYDFNLTSDKDWTYNKPKAKQLLDSVEKLYKTLEQVLKIYQANLDNNTNSEAKINKILVKQTDNSLNVYLFRRLVRIYFSERICLNDSTQKLTALIELTSFAKQEISWLLKTFYLDDTVDKLISIEIKMDIFSFMQEIKILEVSIKTLTMQCICTHLFKQFEIAQVLFKDKYPNFDTHASLEDIHSWQQTIRKGSKRMSVEETNNFILKNSPKISRKMTEQDNNSSSPQKDQDSKDSPFMRDFSPSRSPRQ